MKKLVLLALIISFTSVAFSQEQIKPSCRHHKAQFSKVTPSPEQLALMESMAFRSDTFDITHYAIHLEKVDYGSRTIQGYCDVFFSPKMEGLNAIHLDLLNMQVDSVLFEGEALNFTYDSLMIHTYFDENLPMEDTTSLRIYYEGRPTIDASGFGGFDFQDGYAYNLGIGLAAIPHNYGRGWFPCFDNFVERSTYEFFITTEMDKFVYAVGTHISTEELGNNEQVFHYHMKQPITTYQAAVAVANYAMTRSFHEGLEKEIPVELVSKPQDTTKFRNSFAFLNEAIEALEQWYGPYQWERVGYVITTRGAMEHPTCVAYPSSLGLNENPYNNMDIMSHELAHHWFGNLTTLTTAYDMWIKEGTSEYGYHLFTKEFLGDDEFYDLIADNQLDVIENAHLADDGYRALSGMPFEYTYGMTTYQKGAAVIHNMHSYLGDSLFKIGVRAILDKYAFSHCDAEEFESTLTESTGIDMSSFFKDWIYAPGFSAFEIDSVNVEANGNQYDVSLHIEQKLHASPHYHTNVPMKCTFYDADWNEHPVILTLDGQFSEVSVSLPFEPVFQFLNQNNFLNNGQFNYSEVISENGKIIYPRSKLDITLSGVADSVLLFNEHIYGAADPILDETVDVQISNTHYWTIDGHNPQNALISTKIYYEGNKETDLDFELINGKEEEVILLYRSDASTDWIEYPHATKNAFIPGDNKGFFRLDSVLFGQYAIGLGDFTSQTEAVDQSAIAMLQVQPNPVVDELTIFLPEGKGISRVQIFSDLGQLLTEQKTEASQIRISLQDQLPGNYFIRAIDAKGKILGTATVIRM